jgi:hypothetical protein
MTTEAKTENPRWTCCRTAIGRKPKAWEFMIWNDWCWAQLAKHHGIKCSSMDNGYHLAAKLGWNNYQGAFDAWQAEETNAGRLTWTELCAERNWEP